MLYLALVTLISVITAQPQYIQTPHGLRLKQCVHEAEEYEVVITDKGNGVEAFYPLTNRRVFHPLLDECIQELNNSKLGDWEDYAYEYTPTMGNFSSLYTLPDENPTPAKQLLYYFIGLVNFDNEPETIIQPVAQYDYSGQYPDGWSMESWNCCPSGQTWSSKTIKLSEDAKNIENYCSSNTTDIVVEMSYNGQTTSLTQSDINRSFNWICATLEAYSVPQCSDYNDKPFNFTNMVITTANGENYTPKWSTTSNNKQCRGGAVIYANNDVGVYGTDAP